MASNQCVLVLLLALVTVEYCDSYRFKRPLPKVSFKHPESMPKDMFKSLKNMTSTADFLKAANMYDKVSKSGNLPSQGKPSVLLPRSAGSVTDFQGMIDLDIQSCMVRPTIYFLKQPPLFENAFVWPHAVKIPLCTGSCGVRHDILACRGNTKVPISFQAYIVSYHKSRKRREVMEEFAKLKDPIHILRKRSMDEIQETTVILEAHADCKCGCTATDEMCKLQNKVLNRDFCQCECAPHAPCSDPFEWHDNLCKCVCKKDAVQHHLECLRNSKYQQIFSPKKCDCECPRRRTCSGMNTFDEKTCLCTCNANASCPSNQSLRYLKDRNRQKQCYCS